MDIRFLEDCLLFEDVLVLGDVHLGYEEGVVREGLLPRIQLKETLEKLDRVFKVLENECIKIKKIVLLGDLKHEFGGILDSEWRDVLRLLDYLIERCKDVVLIKGNHDNFLRPVVKERGIRLRDCYVMKIKGESVCFLHGDKMFKQCLDSDVLIIGHLHAAISFKDKYKQEKFKCFLHGVLNKGAVYGVRKEVYILPSFSENSYGYDLRKLGNGNGLRGGKGSKEFLIIDNRDLLKFEVFVYGGDRVRGFGKLRGLV